MKKILLKLTGLKLIASVFGLLYSILQVRFFGASGQVDAFFIATSSVYLITSLLQGGQLAEVFMPEYLNQKKTNSITNAHLLLSAIMTRILVIGVIVLILLFFLAPFIINLLGPGLDIQYKSLSINLFYISLPLILLTLIASFTNTTLNAEQIYGRAEMTGLISSLVSTTLLILFYQELGVYVLVYALLAGKIIDFLVTLYFLHQIGYKYSFTWSVPNFNINSFFKVMLTTSGYVTATQIYSTLLTAMSSYLPVGSISIFNYVQQLYVKASGILNGPLNTVFFSKFSNHVADQKVNLDDFMKRPLIATVVINFLMFCFIYFVGEELLHVLWSKKNLSVAELSIAYKMLVLGFFALIFGSAGQLFRRASVAHGKANLLYKGWIVAQLLSIPYTFVAIYYFGINGLITIPLVNTFLMAYVCVYVAKKVDINVNLLAKELFLKKEVFLFTAIISLSTFFINYYLKLEMAAIYAVILKGALFGFITLVATLVCFRDFVFKSFKKPK
jgi:peptidoglycan biosynthesis protein MviN/MurJ (putative lipid II flippase)